VHTSSDKDASRIFDEVKPKLIQSGSSAVLSVEGRNNARVDLTVEIPATASTTITAGHGDVTVQGLKAASDVTASHGDVKFDNMGANIHARMDHGDFSAHQVAGDVTVDGHSNDVTLSEIKGKVNLDGEFFGDTHLEQVGSAVHFHSSRTDLEIPRLLGDMTMDSSDLNISQAAGPMRIITRSKDIDLSQITGDAHVEKNNGDITVTAGVPLGNIQINNRTGNITVTVPENASFSFVASNADGDLDTDFATTTNNSGDRKSAQGQVGKGGPHLELATGHGDLQLRRGGLVAPPAAPVPPVPPVPPVGARHLHAPKDTSELPTEQ